MNLRVALALFIFSISLSLIGNWAGIGELSNDQDIGEIVDELDIDLPDDPSAIDYISEGWKYGSTLFDLLIALRPSLTGVGWFDLLVWGGISFSIFLGAVHLLRGGGG